MITGAWALLKMKIYPVIAAVLTFAMIAALASAFTQRRVDAVQEGFVKAFSLPRESIDKDIQDQLIVLSALPINEFMHLVQESANRDSSTKDRTTLGISYALQAGPYILLEFLIDITALFVASIFFFLLFTRGTLSGIDVSKMLPGSIIPSLGLLLWSIVRPLFFVTMVGPVLALAIYLSGEAGIRKSVSIGAKRFFKQPFRIFLSACGALAVGFLLLWPLLILVSVTALFSVKIAFFLLLCTLFFIIAFLCAAFTVLGAMIA
jgi:hypothetical protein